MEVCAVSVWGFHHTAWHLSHLYPQQTIDEDSRMCNRLCCKQHLTEWHPGGLYITETSCAVKSDFRNLKNVPCCKWYECRHVRWSSTQIWGTLEKRKVKKEVLCAAAAVSMCCTDTWWFCKHAAAHMNKLDYKLWTLSFNRGVIYQVMKAIHVGFSAVRLHLCAYCMIALFSAELLQQEVCRWPLYNRKCFFFFTEK